MASRINVRGSAISVLVAESCPMSCELMAAALERNRLGLTVVASATDTTEVLNSYLSTTPDICILGANLKDEVSSGFKPTRKSRTQNSHPLSIPFLDPYQTHP